jgi:hypothetical protein
MLLSADLLRRGGSIGDVRANRLELRLGSGFSLAL